MGWVVRCVHEDRLNRLVYRVRGRCSFHALSVYIPHITQVGADVHLKVHLRGVRLIKLLQAEVEVGMRSNQALSFCLEIFRLVGLVGQLVIGEEALETS